MINVNSNRTTTPITDNNSVYENSTLNCVRIANAHACQIASRRSRIRSS